MAICLHPIYSAYIIKRGGTATPNDAEIWSSETKKKIVEEETKAISYKPHRQDPISLRCFSSRPIHHLRVPRIPASNKSDFLSKKYASEIYHHGDNLDDGASLPWRQVCTRIPPIDAIGIIGGSIASTRNSWHRDQSFANATSTMCFSPSIRWPGLQTQQ